MIHEAGTGGLGEPKLIAEATLAETIRSRVRLVLGDHARLAVDIADISDHADLFQAGMTSHASVNVMLALENEFGIEFPDAMLRRNVFETVDAIVAAIASVSVEIA